MAAFLTTELAALSNRRDGCYGPLIAPPNGAAQAGGDVVQTWTGALFRDRGGDRSDHACSEAAAHRAAGALASARTARNAARREAARPPSSRRHADFGGRGVSDEGARGAARRSGCRRDGTLARADHPRHHRARLSRNAAAGRRTAAV